MNFTYPYFFLYSSFKFIINIIIANLFNDNTPKRILYNKGVLKTTYLITRVFAYPKTVHKKTY